MLKLSIANNVTRKSVMVPENSTIREAFENNGVDFTGASVNMDGSILGPGEINKTFLDFGYNGTPGRDKVMLRAIVKADNA